MMLLCVAKEHEIKPIVEHKIKNGIKMKSQTILSKVKWLELGSFICIYVAFFVLIKKNLVLRQELANERAINNLNNITNTKKPCVGKQSIKERQERFECIVTIRLACIYPNIVGGNFSQRLFQSIDFLALERLYEEDAAISSSKHTTMQIPRYLNMIHDSMRLYTLRNELGWELPLSTLDVHITSVILLNNEIYSAPMYSCDEKNMDTVKDTMMYYMLLYCLIENYKLHDRNKPLTIPTDVLIAVQEIKRCIEATSALLDKYLQFDRFIKINKYIPIESTDDAHVDLK